MGKNFRKPLAFCEFSLDFQSENGFELTKDRRIEMRGSRWLRAYFCFSYCLTPPPTFILFSYVGTYVDMYPLFPH